MLAATVEVKCARYFIFVDVWLVTTKKRGIADLAELSVSSSESLYFSKRAVFVQVDKLLGNNWVTVDLATSSVFH